MADPATNAQVSGTARVSGTALVYGDARVYGDAQVTDTRHVLTVGPVGSENQTITMWRTANGHGLSVGCWENHVIDELAAEVNRRCPDRADEYAELETVLRRRINEWWPS